MSAKFFTCTMCGYAFDPVAHEACQACPLSPGCTLVCCPSCGHASVDVERSRLARWVGSLFSSKKDTDGTYSG